MLPKYSIVLGLLMNAVGGLVIIYLVGTIGLVLRTDVGIWAAVSTNFAFIPGDLVKVVVATVVATTTFTRSPGMNAKLVETAAQIPTSVRSTSPMVPTR